MGSPTFVVASFRRRYEQLRLRASRQGTVHSHEQFPQVNLYMDIVSYYFVDHVLGFTYYL